MTLSTITLGNGCFWCTEAVFQRLAGVHSVVSGYSGGTVENPTYRQVCEGTTGHAEAVQIQYDPQQIRLEQLLQVFFGSHDPTTLNRQGADVGTQYRSVIFYHDAEQQRIAQQVIAALEARQVWTAPIVTELSPFTQFYPAENYHQDYYALHGHEPYCQFTIRPKLEKLQKAFGELLAPDDGLGD